MKSQPSPQSSSAPLRAASVKFILTGLIAAAAGVALSATASAQISNKPFTLDGQFTNGFSPSGPNPAGEWGDVTPFAFQSTPGGTVPLANPNDPLRNTLLYAAISHNIGSSGNEIQLHLMYDFLPRTLLPLPGELVASVTFPVTLQGRAKDNISVVLKGHAAANAAANGVAISSFFDIFVDLDVNDPNSPLFPLNPAQFPGLQAVGSFGGSSLSPVNHLLVELEVPLRIPDNFGTPGGPLDSGGGHGINPATGMYDPDPVFWGAAAGGNGNGPLVGGKGVSSLSGPLQNATSAIIGINPNGSLTVTPTPEPTSAVLLLGSLGLLGARRRRA